MDANPDVVARTEADVEGKLRAAGRTERDLEGRCLREKIVELLELRNPALKANWVAVWVALGPVDGVRLPVEAVLVDVYKLLKEVVKGRMALLGDCVRSQGEQGQGVWKYQLLASDLTSVIQKSSTRLETNEDWERLRLILGSEIAPVAVLTQVRHCFHGDWRW